MGGLELYWFDLDAAESRVAAWRAWLSPAERDRAARFLAPEHGRRFTAARAHLRWLLGRRLGCGPGEVAFELGVYGKPGLAGAPFQFNLSHSGRYALVGLHPDRELGVDIEAERASLDGLGVARRFFTPAEAVWLEALPPAARRRGFCRLWTCKEAWMKSDGRGLALPLDRVEVSFPPGGAELRTVAPPRQGWFVRELELISGYCAAVVMKSPPGLVRIEELKLET